MRYFPAADVRERKLLQQVLETKDGAEQKFQAKINDFLHAVKQISGVFTKTVTLKTKFVNALIQVNLESVWFKT